MMMMMMKVTQYECGNLMMPTLDCLQYHTSSTGTDKIHLQNLQRTKREIYYLLRINRQLQLGHLYNVHCSVSDPSLRPVLRHLHPACPLLLLRLLLPQHLRHHHRLQLRNRLQCRCHHCNSGSGHDCQWCHNHLRNSC